MKIMITGGYDEKAADTADGKVIIDFAQKLAEQVIEQKHDLVCGNISSLDKIIIEAACEKCEAIEIDPETRVVSYHPKGVDPRCLSGAVKGSSISHWNSIDGRRLSIPEPIKQADVVVLIGGYGSASGTYTAANWAKQTGTPVLPIATFNMAAGDIFDDLNNTQDATKITGLTLEDLPKLTKAKASLNAIDVINRYAEQIVSLAEKAALSRDVFLIMSFDNSDELLDYQAAVVEVCKKEGFDAIRTDTRPSDNSHQIIDKIHEHIQQCGFVIADLTKARPNVYYEIGYAMGLGKKIVLTSKINEQIHFDLQGYNRIVWSGSENLKKQLTPVLNEIADSFGLK